MEQLSPRSPFRCTIDAGYRLPIGPVEDFLAGKTNVRRSDSSELNLPGPSALRPRRVVVLKPSL